MNEAGKVFVVDNDAAVRDALAMLLEAGGHDVAAFASARDFLAACTPECRGCIILDLNMPDMDGPTLQQELLRRGIRLPIIFLSGHGSRAMRERVLQAGALEFLTKPVSGAVLLACVEQALQRGPRARP